MIGQCMTKILDRSAENALENARLLAVNKIFFATEHYSKASAYSVPKILGIPDKSL